MAFVEIDHVGKIFALPNGASYIALKNIELKIRQGEFVSLIGHSGCGKSTLLNMVAGLDRPTEGGVILEGREIRRPGPERVRHLQLRGAAAQERLQQLHGHRQGAPARYDRDVHRQVRTRAGQRRLLSW